MSETDTGDTITINTENGFYILESDKSAIFLFVLGVTHKVCFLIKLGVKPCAHN